MPCRTIVSGNGSLGIVCTRGERRRRCSTPNCNGTGIAQCDFPVKRNGKEATCDRYMCASCRTSKGDNIDHCPPHARVDASSEPRRGDRRIHIATGIDLWVLGVDEHAGERHVTFARNPPDTSGRCLGPLQTVSLAKWTEKTRAP